MSTSAMTGFLGEQQPDICAPHRPNGDGDENGDGGGDGRNGASGRAGTDTAAIAIVTVL